MRLVWRCIPAKKACNKAHPMPPIRLSGWVNTSPMHLPLQRGNWYLQNWVHGLRMLKPSAVYSIGLVSCGMHSGQSINCMCLVCLISCCARRWYHLCERCRKRPSSRYPVELANNATNLTGESNSFLSRYCGTAGLRMGFRDGPTRCLDETVPMFWR